MFEEAVKVLDEEINNYKAVKEAYDVAKERLDTYKQNFEIYLRDNNLNKAQFNDINIVLGEDKETTGFDFTAYCKAHPGTEDKLMEKYPEFVKTTKRKGSLRITIK